MIEEGNGTLEKRIQNELCPRCEAYLAKINDQEQIKCRTCGLIMGNMQIRGAKSV